MAYLDEKYEEQLARHRGLTEQERRLLQRRMDEERTYLAEREAAANAPQYTNPAEMGAMGFRLGGPWGALAGVGVGSLSRFAQKAKDGDWKSAFSDLKPWQSLYDVGDAFGQNPSGMVSAVGGGYGKMQADQRRAESEQAWMDRMDRIAALSADGERYKVGAPIQRQEGIGGLNAGPDWTRVG